MNKPSFYLPLLLLIGVSSVSSCKTDANRNNANEPSSNQVTAKKWKLPDPELKGCKVIVNEEFKVSEVDWLSPASDKQATLKLIIFWKTDSPIANLTFKKIQSLSQSLEAVECNFISQQQPPLTIPTNSLNKTFRFGVNKNNSLAEQIDLKTFPQALLLTKKNIVCWQGHPENLSSDTISSILEELEK